MLKLTIRAQQLLQILKSECGQDSVEYAILIGIVAVGVIGSVGTIATYVQTTFASLATAL